MENKNNIRQVCSNCGDVSMKFFNETGGLQALLDITKDRKEIYVKCAFEDNFGIEHMWLQFVMYDSKTNTVKGILNNEPIVVKSFKCGDIVSIAVSKISNFMYVENNATHSYVPL